MNNLTKWNFENSEVRTLTIENEPYFVGKDVATVLGYSNPRKALLDHIDEEDKLDGVTIRDSIGREQKPVVTVLSYQVSYRLQRNLRDG
jgi:prophage antirepressor-like protein